MTKYRETLDRVFHALSDGTRRAIVARLVHGPASVSHLAEPLDLALPTVMQHLGVLEDAGIVASHKIGRTRTVQLVPDAFVDDMWLDDRHASTSITTVEFAADGDRTQLTFTEQGVHLDGVQGPGPDAAAGREHGTRELLEGIETALAATTGPDA